MTSQAGRRRTILPGVRLALVVATSSTETKRALFLTKRRTPLARYVSIELGKLISSAKRGSSDLRPAQGLYRFTKLPQPGLWPRNETYLTNR